jgi:nucleoside-diphosphate-sugar epimerase
MKIGIIGCGYVGQAMALRWKPEGHTIAVTTRHPEKVPFFESLAHHVHVLKEGTLNNFLSQQDVVLVSVAPGASSDYRSTYLNTAHQIKEQIAHTPRLKYVLYTSSTSVYGDHQGAWVDENTSIVPAHEQARILHETEQVLLSCASTHLKVCILRLGEIYGPGREISERLRRMQSQSFAGTGKSYTNLIHLTDIVEALDFTLQKRLEGIYNLCNDFHVPRRQLYEQLCQQKGIPPLQWDPTKTSQHAGNKRVSNQKIKTAGFVFSESVIL